MLSTRLKHQIRDPIWGIASGLTVAMLWCAPPFKTLLRRIEDVAHDVRLSYAPSPPKDEKTNVAVVGISEGDETLVDRFPFPRKRYAEAIRLLADAGAKAILLDVFFVDRDSHGQVNDDELEAAMRETGIVVLSEYSPAIRTGLRADAHGVHRGRWIHNLARFRDAAARIGHINVLPDKDGIVRRLPALAGPPGDKSPKFFPATLTAALMRLGIDAKPALLGDREIQAGPLRIPLDSARCIPINHASYVHPWSPDLPGNLQTAPITLYSFHEVLSLGDGKSAAVPPEAFKDRVVLIGYAIQGTEQDMHSTPVGRRFGVLIQAKFVHSVLTSRFVRIPREATTFTLILAISIPLGALALKVRLGGSRYALIGGYCVILVIALMGLGYLSIQLFNRWGLMMHVTPFAIMLILHSGASLGSSLSRAEKEADLRGGEVDFLIRVGEAAAARGTREKGPEYKLGYVDQGVAAISSIVKSEGAATRILESLDTTLPCEGSMLYSLDPVGDELRISGVLGFEHKLAPESAARFASNMNRRLRKALRTVLVPNVAQKPELRREISGLDSLLVVPVVHRRRLIGALHLYNRIPSDDRPAETFTKADAKLVQATASQAAVAMDNERLYREMHGIFTDYIRSMAAAIDARDRYTHGHSVSVAQYSVGTGKLLGLTPADLELIELAATVHDVGKIGVPEHILNKPGKLTDEEFAQIKAHPMKGTKIISEMVKLRSLLPAVRHHHERFDGKGYPDGLEGGDIPLMARIVCVADAYDAMTSDRIYRPGMPKEVACERLEEGAGTQFDLAVVKAFLAYIGDLPREPGSGEPAEPKATTS